LPGAIAVSVSLQDGETPLRLSFLGRALAGTEVAAASAAFGFLALQNRTFEPNKVEKRRGSLSV